MQNSEKESACEASPASRSPDDEPAVAPGASEILHLSVSPTGLLESFLSVLVSVH